MTAIQPTSFVAFNPLLANVEQIITASNESIAREGLKGSIGSTAASWKVLEVPQHLIETWYKAYRILFGNDKWFWKARLEELQSFDKPQKGCEVEWAAKILAVNKFLNQ